MAAIERALAHVDLGRNHAYRHELFNGNHGSHHINNGIDSPDFMKMNRLRWLVVDLPFGFCEPAERLNRLLPGPRGESARIDHPPDIVETAVVMPVAMIFLAADFKLGSLNACSRATGDRQMVTAQRQQAQLFFQPRKIHTEIQQGAQKHVAAYPREWLDEKNLRGLRRIRHIGIHMGGVYEPGRSKSSSPKIARQVHAQDRRSERRVRMAALI